MEVVQSRGLVIKAMLHGNTSQVVTIFSEKNGVISGSIQGGFKQ